MLALALVFCSTLPVNLEFRANGQNGAPSLASAENEALAATNGWVSSGGYWYYYVNGYAVTGWRVIDGYWYYFNSTGRMAVGWITNGGYWYYLYPSYTWGSSWEGRLAQYGWEQLGGSTWYYLRTSANNIAYGPTGAMLEGGFWYFAYPYDAYYWLTAEGSWDSQVLSTYLRGATLSQSDRDSLSSNYRFYSGGTYYQNCLAYALNRSPIYNTRGTTNNSNNLWNSTDWIWPWNGSNPSVSTAQSWVQSSTSFTHITTSQPSAKPFIVAYKNSRGYVTHFARENSSGSVYAKWGSSSIYQHDYPNAYRPNGSYGSIAFYAY
jgi:hypothetical protein